MDLIKHAIFPVVWGFFDLSFLKKTLLFFSVFSPLTPYPWCKKGCFITAQGQDLRAESCCLSVFFSISTRNISVSLGRPQDNGEKKGFMLWDPEDQGQILNL